MSAKIDAVDDESFVSDVLEAEGPVLVDFWAEWCKPCKDLSVVLESVMAAYQGKITFKKMDVDACKKTPPKYGVRGIPTLMLFKEGNVESTKVGCLSKSELTAFLDSTL